MNNLSNHNSNKQQLSNIDSLIEEAIMKQKPQLPEKEEWNYYWIKTYNKIERITSWVLISLGIIMLLTFFIYSLLTTIFQEVEMPIVIKIGLISLILGFIILIISIIREKHYINKKDKYKKEENL